MGHGGQLYEHGGTATKKKQHGFTTKVAKSTKERQLCPKAQGEKNIFVTFGRSGPDVTLECLIMTGRFAPAAQTLKHSRT
ncbi:MAG: hypothetical protein ACREQW_13140 [Candidatus Binatia bacterium]